MQEILSAALLAVNLPYTILMVLVGFYWLSVFIGVLDLEFLDFDMDADVDIDVDVDVDADMDADVGEVPGIGHTLISFINLGDVPMMIIVSFLALSLWSVSILVNHFLGNSGWLIAVLLLIPNLLFGAVVTKIITTPFKKFFRSLTKDEGSMKSVIGQICTLLSDASGDRFGQAEILAADLETRVTVKTWKGETLKKGQKAIIIEKDKEKDFYFIEEFKEWES